MRVVRARPTVKFATIQPAGFCILAALHQAAQACQVDLIITCGTEEHGMKDPHTLGEAYDVSVRDLAPESILDLKVCLDRLLGPLFTVLFEVPDKQPPTDPRLQQIATPTAFATAPHFHLQRKKDTVYPPPTAAQRPSA